MIKVYASEGDCLLPGNVFLLEKLGIVEETICTRHTNRLQIYYKWSKEHERYTIHNEEGPAIVYPNGTMHYVLQDAVVAEEEWRTLQFKKRLQNILGE